MDTCTVPGPVARAQRVRLGVEFVRLVCPTQAVHSCPKQDRQSRIGMGLARGSVGKNLEGQSVEIRPFAVLDCCGVRCKVEPFVHP